MTVDERAKALSAWHALFTTRDAHMGPADQYERLIGLADSYQHQDLITIEEKNAMILRATEHYASAVQTLVQGTV
ncbi:hypothetical protein KC131_04130 [Pseudomonas sp. JQ170]|uniref:hypothetical protein n=1 Tax=unclassified Pseudomonas TaxID=196821 RepID=UPI0026507202|nr:MULTISPECIES: hypothetical protein [unclassified Pseudomonas]MDN7139823.1 hypothetical protein [Pseudomonas sp. JQ170]WRO73723.1 hypothetical protein U9R80_14395 [Pseudomonas sp. 170C]